MRQDFLLHAFFLLGVFEGGGLVCGGIEEAGFPLLSVEGRMVVDNGREGSAIGQSAHGKWPVEEQ